MASLPETNTMNEASPSIFSRLITIMIQHRNAANLLMIILIAFGLYGLHKISTQFFPNIEIKVVSVSIEWIGAGADDIDTSIVDPIQASLRFINGVTKISSTAQDGIALFSIEFKSRWDMSKAKAEVETAINQLTTLPTDIERPIVQQFTLFEPVGILLLYGNTGEKNLKTQAKKIQSKLLAAGVDKVRLVGARDEEIWVTTAINPLRQYNLTPLQIAQLIEQHSLDIPAGLLRNQTEQRIRIKGRVKSADHIRNIEVRSLPSGDKLTIGDIATVEENFNIDQPTLWHTKHPAIKIQIERSKTTDALTALAVVKDFFEENKAIQPPNIQLEIFSLEGVLIKNCLNIMFKNGMNGMIFVVFILFLFLNFRVALWVSIGVPTAVLTTLGLMWLLGNSLNMISMFSFIMMIGVIVDDAVVVGEHTTTVYDRGNISPHNAAKRGVLRMASPIFVAILTTLFAFLPLFLIEGTFGEMVRPIPTVVAIVLCASLLECYFILPAHMAHALTQPRKEPYKLKKKFLEIFYRFRDEKLPQWVTQAYDRRYITLSVAVSGLIIAFSLIASGQLVFRFFPAPETETLSAQISYHSGTLRHTTQEGLKRVEEALHKSNENLRGDLPSLIQSHVIQLGVANSPRGLFAATSRTTGNNVATLLVQLIPSEERTVRTDTFLQEWQKNIPKISGVENILIGSAVEAPGGSDIALQIQGDNLYHLKQAAIKIKESLKTYAGIVSVGDTLNYGKSDIILNVNSKGTSLGFNNQNIGEQVRHGFEGVIAQRFVRDSSEVTVKIRMPHDKFQNLSGFYLTIPQTHPPEYIALPEVVHITERPNFAKIRRAGEKRTVQIHADLLADSASTPDNIKQDIMQKIVPDLEKKYNIHIGHTGEAEEAEAVLKTLKQGAIIALGLIYIVLALAFSSYSTPLIIMSIIPFGFIGALVGHFVQGHDLNFLSIVALLGLSGILVNNSIILVNYVEACKKESQSLKEAIVAASIARFRPVILTSLTTILGLAPLSFETSAQAQFLIPIAITITWGMAIAGLLVLFLIPAILGIQNDILLFLKKLRVSLAPKMRSE